MDSEEKVIMMKTKSGLDVSRRILKASRYIGYDALKNDVPDKRRGKPDLPDNKYRRPCDVISTCYRFTN